MTKEEDRWIKEILLLLEERGWRLAMPNVDGESPVEGMIVGTDEYIDWIASGEFLEKGVEKWTAPGDKLVH